MNNVELIPLEWGEIIAVVFTGLIVVFSALLGLVVILYITGAIGKALGNKAKATAQPAPAAPAAPAPAAKAEFVPPVGPGPVVDMAVEDGIPSKTVAAISSAVTVALEGQGSFAVKSIKRSEKK